MKQKNKIFMIAALGICLAAGGTAFGIAWNNRNQPQQNSDSAQSIGDTQTQSAPEQINGDASLLNAKLTGEADAPGLPSTMIKAENGFYYFGRIGVPSDGRFITSVLKYADNQSGESVILCAKPECTHRNEYCTARNTRYHNAYDEAVYYDGYLYQMVIKYPSDAAAPEARPNQIVNRYEGAEPILIRYAPDGTGLEELVSFDGTLSETLKDFAGSARITAHRGALWIAADFNKCVDAYGAAPEEITTSIYQQYGIYHYDIAGGKLTCVLSTEKVLENTGIGRIKDLNAVGDYVYCLKVKADWKDPLNKYSGVIRINAKTGAVEQLIPDATQYAICENEIVYTKEVYVTNAQGYSVLRETFHIYDLQTGESRPFLEGSYWNYPKFTCTNDYLILTATEFDSPQLLPLMIYDRQGDPLAEIAIPTVQWEGSTPAGNVYEQLEALDFVAADGDTLYLGSWDALCDCSIPDLLAGTAKWTMRYNDSETALQYGTVPEQ